ncbi:MAG: Uma2 family endonuclease, partial [Selenomonadaceae bacterium]|nr:Uma2 family endonuclease [Selenomonadaceae bacterium]
MLVDFEEYDRTEVIDGVEYQMSPPNMSHVVIRGNIESIFRQYLKGKRCKVFSEFDVILDEENTFIPDVIINCDASKVHQDGIHGAPELVVEILSRSTLKRDRTVKKDAYEKAGVKEYWIVSPNDKTIEIYRLQDGKFYLDKAVG